MKCSSPLRTVDIRRIIAALTLDAGDFQLNGQWLLHRSSHYSFRFAKDGELALVLLHGILLVPVGRDQARALSQAARVWRQNHRSVSVRAKPLMEWSGHVDMGQPPKYSDAERKRKTSFKESIAVFLIVLASVFALVAENQLIHFFRDGNAAAVGENRPVSSSRQIGSGARQ